MRSEPNDPYPGYVYIFYVAGFNPKEPRPTKIGFCHYRHNESPNETVVRRLKDIERHHWQSFVYRFSKALCCANVEEYFVHRKYEKYRIRGEWFNLTFRQIENIRKYLDSQYEY